MYYEELNLKDKVMLTIGTEYDKDIPDFDRALKGMDIDTKVIKAALIKLSNEDYIKGIMAIRTNRVTASKSVFNPDGIDISQMIPTVKGIEYVEGLREKLGFTDR